MNFNQYLESRNYSIKTIESYNKSINMFLEWLTEENIKQHDATYNDVMAYIKTRAAILNLRRLNFLRIKLLYLKNFNRNP